MTPTTLILPEIRGQWQGKHQLFLKPDELAEEGSVQLTVSQTEIENVIKLQYEHHIEENTHQGIFLISFLQEQTCEAAWIDTFHTNLGVMKFTGQYQADGLKLHGGYQAGEDFWKWTIDFRLQGEKFIIQHYNQPPGGEPNLGVDFQLSRIE